MSMYEPMCGSRLCSNANIRPRNTADRSLLNRRYQEGIIRKKSATRTIAMPSTILSFNRC